jgi:hypothetical protein
VVNQDDGAAFLQEERELAPAGPASGHNNIKPHEESEWVRVKANKKDSNSCSALLFLAGTLV